ncbi:hypothetical protein F9802_16060 [Bacillus aerolatus]|uniref:YjzC family protein n=1 Tax=Bacillus aerolatus TaxID=2653354 RepID=A0A6I1FGX7_9BACI|nr:hypothetical protein [Bacillus aerolatus]KAB7704694.1 hypothetical protein F9802_16060 [Bacillus aerolatus]
MVDHSHSDLHHTNDAVLETGKYICAEGAVKELQKGDHFPSCPKTAEPTTWRHAAHEHKTGEKVTETGRYVDEDGDHVDLKNGDTFPNCPKSGSPTAWKHADE